MIDTIKAIKLLCNLHLVFLQFWNSSFFQRIIDIANSTYLKGEQYSRDFIICKFDLGDYIRKNGWDVLLKSMTYQQTELLQIKLDKKDQ